MRWNVSQGATRYLLAVGTTIGSTNLFNGTVGNITAVNSDAVDPNIPVFARVSAANACGISPPTADLSLPPPGGGTPPPCLANATTMCLFGDRFAVSAELFDGTIRPALVNRRFPDGGGFSFTAGSGIDDLFMRIDNRCATDGRYDVSLFNQSGFSPATGFRLIVGDPVGSIRREYVHPPGAQFVQFTDSTSFTRCP